MESVFRFGVDYYPEQWPEALWETDARLMQEAGFNVVRLAKFAWSRLEPQEWHFDFAWLGRAIDLLRAHGMDVVLGTPTASPPLWVMRKYPDAYRMLADGRRVPSAAAVITARTIRAIVSGHERALGYRLLEPGIRRPGRSSGAKNDHP